jgi:cation:H+ antiporter
VIVFLAAVVVGLVVLVWSADRFVEGAACTSYRAGMSPLLVGMIVVGFGTSAPELVVSAIASYQGNPGLALGNAIGSNISNIALILGLTALLVPVAVHSNMVRKELPQLGVVTLLLWLLLLDGQLARWNGVVLLVTFFVVMTASALRSSRSQEAPLSGEVLEGIDPERLSLRMAIFWLVVGLVILILSSRAVVWGAVGIAQTLGVSDVIIGLTVVAVGTSLPELASTLAAARKGEHDLAIGNIVGSNLFNTLAVVGIAAVVHPLEIERVLLTRDIPVMVIMTVALFVVCLKVSGLSRISRIEGGALVLAYVGYTIWIILAAMSGSA